MKPKDELSRSMKKLTRAIRQAASEAGDGSTINVATRRNIVVEGNVGGSGGTHVASNAQRVRIRQNGEESTEIVSNDGTVGNA